MQQGDAALYLVNMSGKRQLTSPFYTSPRAFARPDHNIWCRVAQLFAVNRRRKYKADAITSTIPFTANSHAVACARIQMIAAMASAGTTFMPGKLNPALAGSARTSRCTKNQHAAQQSRYISRTATLESTASFSNVPVIDKAKASTAYVMIATSGER